MDVPSVNLASPTVTPPSPQHLEQIAAARKLIRPVRRAARTALFSGWTTAFFGVITLATSFSSLLGIALGVGMCAISYFEFQGARRIRQLDVEAPRHLAINQIIFGILLTIYAVLSLHATLTTPTDVGELGNDPQVQQMLSSFDVGNLMRTIYLCVYGALVIAAIFGCGGTAWYYASRKKYIEKYLREAPPWITELQRAGMSV